MFKKLPLLVFLFAAHPIMAQKLVDAQLILPIEQAITTNYSLLNQQLEVIKSESQAAGVRAKHLPEVSSNMLYTHITQRGILDVPIVTLPISGLELFEGSQSFRMNANVFNTGLSAKQIIFSGLQLNNAEKALKEKANAENLMAEAGKEALAKEVITSFDQLMLLNEAEKLIEDTESRLEKESLRIKKAIQNGLAIPYDRDKIALAMLELEAKKVELSGNRKLLYQKLAQLSHMEEDQLQRIQYELSVIDLPIANANADQRLELRALQHSSNALDYKLKQEKGAALPSVFAFGTVSYSTIFHSKLSLKDVGPISQADLKLNQLSLFPNVLVGIGAKWDLFAGGAHKQKITQAKVDLQINENKRREIEEQLKLLVQKTQTDYENGLLKLKINKQRVAVAQNNMTIASKQYQEGLITITDRLGSENDWFKSSLDFYSQLVEQRQTALAYLEAQGLLLNNIFN